MSAKHSDVHLFWGDLPDKIADNIAEIRKLAREHGRDNEIGFGMRLQIICREHEDEAWEAADELVRHASERLKQLEQSGGRPAPRPPTEPPASKQPEGR